MGVGAIEEILESIGIVGVELSVVDEVFSGVFGIVRPSVLWEMPH